MKNNSKIRTRFILVWSCHDAMFYGEQFTGGCVMSEYTEVRIGSDDQSGSSSPKLWRLIAGAAIVISVLALIGVIMSLNRVNNANNIVGEFADSLRVVKSDLVLARREASESKEIALATQVFVMDTVDVDLDRVETGLGSVRTKVANLAAKVETADSSSRQRAAESDSVIVAMDSDINELTRSVTDSLTSQRQFVLTAQQQATSGLAGQLSAQNSTLKSMEKRLGRVERKMNLGLSLAGLNLVWTGVHSLDDAHHGR